MCQQEFDPVSGEEKVPRFHPLLKHDQALGFLL